ncbi:MAG: hypothetical protein FJ271_01665 [Planctomycetes bacterium]|nr:hypothetical protein [Planctomycetota bacterium]
MGALRLSCLVIPILLASGVNQAQGFGKKNASLAPQAEVRFGDGSLVRMAILQESLEVMTKYGKLTIPVGDIRRIEFGMHLPEGAGTKIQSAIRKMGSDVYKQREEAVKDLLDLEHYAMPSLEKAVRSGDLEVAQRASSVIKRLSERIAPENLRTKDHDTIQTVEFLVTGRIISPTIKAHSAHFGDLTLKLTDLRTMHLRGGKDELELTVDASKYGSATDQWLDSGTVVDPNLRLIVRSDGQIDLWPQGPGQYMTGPKGYTTAGKGGTFMAGTLLGRVGNDGKAFVIGEQFEGIPPREGRLYLHIVPSPWNNASAGTYRVKIRTDYVALTSR